MSEECLPRWKPLPLCSRCFKGWTTNAGPTKRGSRINAGSTRRDTINITRGCEERIYCYCWFELSSSQNARGMISAKGRTRLTIAPAKPNPPLRQTGINQSMVGSLTVCGATSTRSLQISAHWWSLKLRLPNPNLSTARRSTTWGSMSWSTNWMSLWLRNLVRT